VIVVPGAVVEADARGVGRVLEVHREGLRRVVGVLARRRAPPPSAHTGGIQPCAAVRKTAAGPLRGGRREPPP
jgi:hypothetical protein